MDPRHSSLAEKWQSELRQGLEHLRGGRLEQAEACFERAHGLAPARPEVCYALGRARLRGGAVTEAEALLRTAWQGDRLLVSAAGTLARCLGLHGKRFDEAYAVLAEAEAHHGPLALLHVVRSELLLAQDRFAEARVEAEAALEHLGSDAEGDAARAALARAINREGIERAEGGDHEGAVFLFKRAAHLDPEWSSPLVNLGAALTHMGMHERAMAAYERAVATEPDNPMAHENRGLLLRHRGDLAGARDALATALVLEPASRGAALALAAVHMERGDAAAAQTVLSEIIERTPDDPELWCELGGAFAAGGDRDSAEACMRRALQIDPYHAGACTGLADLLVRDGRFHEAMLMAQRAQGLAPPLAGLVPGSDRSRPHK